MNTLKIGETTYINLLTNPIRIKSGDDIFKIGKNKGKKPEIVAEHIILENEPIDTYIRKAVRIKNLPDERERIKIIVPLFIVDAYSELINFGLINPRFDLYSPGKKVFDEDGVVLYADGLRMGYEII